MPKPSGVPLLKVTLNLFHDDVLALKSRYGYGYTMQIRDIIHRNVVEYRKHKATIADYVTEDLDVD